jgi:large subunit ribosomal protein L18
MARNKQNARHLRKERIRKRVHGTSARPRLSIYRSVNHIYAQVIDDVEGKTLLGLSTQSKAFPSSKDAGNVKGARELGKLVAKKALEKKISQVVFDRSGFLYHGRVKAFAEGAREEGLKF